MIRVPCIYLLFLIIPFLWGLYSLFCLLYHVWPLLSWCVLLSSVSVPIHLFSPALSLSTLFLPQACKETLPLWALLISLASPVLLNILKAWEDSGYYYVTNEEPEKSLCPRSAQWGPCWLLFIAVGPWPAQPSLWAHWQCLFWLLWLDLRIPRGKPGDWRSSVLACLWAHVHHCSTSMCTLPHPFYC